MTPLSTIYSIIFLEGYIVLSTELLAIRLLIPFTGSGTDTVSIIIAAVLLPLACGYFAGGRFKKTHQGSKRTQTVRKKLISNLVIAAAILSFGLSYAFLEYAFDLLHKILGWRNRIGLTVLYSAVFIVYPVYLLGQTVPLISNFFSRQRFSAVAGRILFFSTLGSFAGAILSTLVFMTFFGVHYTAIITIACITALVFLLSKRKTSESMITTIFFLIISFWLNGPQAMKDLKVVSNNKYSTLQVMEDSAGTRFLFLNRTLASAVHKKSSNTSLEYSTHLEKNFFLPMLDKGPKKSVLILGAGGFTIGRRDTKNIYTYVDLDAALKKISEDLLLREKLTPNKKFVAMDARAFLVQSEDKFDLILLDLFRDPISVHENLNTLEFFQEVKDHLAMDGVMVANYWASPAFSDAYSRNLDYTLRYVFPALNREIIGGYDIWRRDNDWKNIIYSFVNVPYESQAVYTDDRNTIIFDKPINALQ